MDKEEFEALGKEDAVEQLVWLTARYRELRKVWKCAICGQELPTYGIWKERWENFRLLYRFQKDPVSTGYFCDSCRV